MGDLLRDDLPEVAHAAPAVHLGIGVDRLAPLARAGEREAVALVRDAREVHDDRDERTVVTLAQEAQHVEVGLTRVDPLETDRKSVV